MKWWREVMKEWIHCHIALCTVTDPPPHLNNWYFSWSGENNPNMEKREIGKFWEKFCLQIKFDIDNCARQEKVREEGSKRCTCVNVTKEQTFGVTLTTENILKNRYVLSTSNFFRGRCHQNGNVMRTILFLSFLQTIRYVEKKEHKKKIWRGGGGLFMRLCIRCWFHSDQIQRHTYTSIYIEASLWGYLSFL